MTCSTDGFVSTIFCPDWETPTTVGTVWLPLLTASTISAASGCLDVDHLVGDALAVELALQPVAVAAPRGGVHREHGHAGNCPLRRLGVPGLTDDTRSRMARYVRPHAHARRPARRARPRAARVAEALRGPVRVLAGAGTGKTRAITHRIAYGVPPGVYAPAEVLAVTFTTRAAGEMRGRLRALGAGGVQARTFHSAALRQLRYFWPRVRRRRAARR